MFKKEEAKENALKTKWNGLSKNARIGVVAGACVVVIALGGVGYAATHPATNAPLAESAPKVQSEQKAKAYSIDFDIEAEGFVKDSSSPVIVHIVGVDADGKKVDFYHAFAPGEPHSIKINEGGYEIEYITPINSDGSMYKVGEKKAVKVEGKAFDVKVKFDPIPADQVTQDDIDRVMAQIKDAVAKGDNTLSGDAGKKVVSVAADNAAKAPNADKNKVEAAKVETEKAVNEQSKAETPAEPSYSSTASASASNSSANASNAPASGGSSTGGETAEAHTHNWSPITSTIHHDAVYEDRPIYETQTVYKTEYHNICNGKPSLGIKCGDRIMSDDDWIKHCREKDCESYKTDVPIQVPDGTQEVQVGTEQVLISAAWDETVTTGYRCSCGATK